jgi:AGZA family xanthine/uracil permease-like MFS transporter
MALAYTLVVTPSILSNAIFLQQPGDLFDELVVATALVSAISTLLISLWTNYPFALAPGMGLNSLFAVSVVLDLKLDWRLALMAALLQGLLFMGLCLSGWHTHLVKAMPLSLKHAIVAGIGLFIASIALSGNPAQLQAIHCPVNTVTFPHPFTTKMPKVISYSSLPMGHR